jgi:hypothetical protein
LHDAANGFAFPPGHNSPAPGHQIHQSPELQLDGGKILVNIGVIEFQ